MFRFFPLSQAPRVLSTIAAMATSKCDRKTQPLQTLPTGATIRYARPGDLMSIKDITKITFASTFRDPITLKPCFSDPELEHIAEHVKQDCENTLNSPNDILLVIDENSKVIGYAKVSIQDHQAKLEKIYVLPEHQGKKLGAYLMLSTMNEIILNAGKAAVVRLEVWDQNDQAIKFYSKFGFHKTNIVTTKTNAAGEPFFGSIMVNANLVLSMQKLSDYLQQGPTLRKQQ